jgi:hypothetical protein
LAYNQANFAGSVVVASQIAKPVTVELGIEALAGKPKDFSG